MEDLILRRSGRRVATQDVAMPSPVSAVDQMATSMVAYRKLFVSSSPRIYGIRTIVAVDALESRQYLDRIRRMEWICEVHLQGSKSKHNCNTNLDFLVHLEIPNHKNRNNAECPVRDTTDGGISIERCYNDGGVDAMSLASTVLVPELGNWPALEDE